MVEVASGGRSFVGSTEPCDKRFLVARAFAVGAPGAPDVIETGAIPAELATYVGTLGVYGGRLYE